MEHVIVERVFAEPVDLAAFSQNAREGASCFDAHRVELLRSYVSHDGLRIICEYSAPDAESVRRANDSARVPYVRVWTASVYEAPF